MRMEERMAKVIEEANFNFLELAGFKSNPQLALKAGAVIGYRMGLCELNRWLTDHSIEGEEEEK